MLPVAQDFIGKDGQFSFWQWMKSEHGFKDAQLKPYTFNVGPFLADKKSIQQGYVTSEPYEIEKQAGWAPKDRSPVPTAVPPRASS